MHVATYLNDFSSSAQVKIQVEFNFKLFEKKNQFFWLPCSSTREDLSIDISITNVGLILTKLRRFQLFVKNQKFEFRTFLKKKIKLLGFHDVVLVRTFPLMYQLLMYRTDNDEAKVISALRQKSKFEFRTFLKKKIFGFPRCSTREDLSIDVSITNVGLILTKLR